MTPIEISSRYDASILLRRWIACWVDFAILGGGSWLVLRAGSTSTQTSITGITAIWVPLVLLYFPVLEGLTGRTIGRLVSRTIVVDEFGLRPGLFRALIRSLFRLVEVNPILAGGLPAGLIVWSSRTRQRLGDLFARTFVLKTEDLRLLLVVAAGDTEQSSATGDRPER